MAGDGGGLSINYAAGGAADGRNARTMAAGGGGHQTGDGAAGGGAFLSVRFSAGGAAAVRNASMMAEGGGGHQSRKWAAGGGASISGHAAVGGASAGHVLTIAVAGQEAGGRVSRLWSAPKLPCRRALLYPFRSCYLRCGLHPGRLAPGSRPWTPRSTSPCDWTLNSTSELSVGVRALCRSPLNGAALRAMYLTLFEVTIAPGEDTVMALYCFSFFLLLFLWTTRSKRRPKRQKATVTRTRADARSRTRSVPLQPDILATNADLVDQRMAMLCFFPFFYFFSTRAKQSSCRH